MPKQREFKLQSPYHDLLTKEQACEYLRLSKSTMDRLIMKREIAFYKQGDPNKKGRARVLFCKKDLDKWMQGCRVAVSA